MMHVTGDVFEVEIGLWVTCVVTLKVKWGLGGGLEVTHVTKDAFRGGNWAVSDLCGHIEGEMGLGWTSRSDACH